MNRYLCKIHDANLRFMYFGNFLGVMEIQGGDYTLNCTFKSTYFTVYEVYLEKKSVCFIYIMIQLKKKKANKTPDTQR